MPERDAFGEKDVLEKIVIYTQKFTYTMVNAAPESEP